MNNKLNEIKTKVLYLFICVCICIHIYIHIYVCTFTHVTAHIWRSENNLKDFVSLFTNELTYIICLTTSDFIYHGISLAYVIYPIAWMLSKHIKYQSKNYKIFIESKDPFYLLLSCSDQEKLKARFPQGHWKQNSLQLLGPVHGHLSKTGTTFVSVYKPHWAEIP